MTSAPGLLLGRRVELTCHIVCPGDCDAVRAEDPEDRARAADAEAAAGGVVL